MAKIFKSLRISNMKKMNFSLIMAVLLVGCQNQEADLELGVKEGEELDISHLAGDPLPSPHEFLIKESPSIE
jgi:hypothetical protein